MGLLTNLLGFSPEQTQGLLGFAAGMAQTAGPSPFPTSGAQGWAAGLKGYQEGMQGARDRAQQKLLMELKLRELQSEADDHDQARKQKRAIEDAARASMLTPGQHALSLGGGPTVANAARIPDMKGGFDTEGFLNQVMAINPLQALELRKSMAKAGPKFDAGITWVAGPDGKPMAVRTADDGSIKQIDGLAPRDKLEFRDGGNAIFGVDQYTGQRVSSLGKGVSPDAALSAATQRRGQDLTDSRQRDANAIARETKQKVADQAKAGQVASFDTMLDTLDRLEKHPGLSRSVGLYSRAPTLPGSDSANFQAELETFKSQAFIPMVAQLKGMGALSDAEGKKLTAAVGALDPKMSEQAFKASIARVMKDMDAARARVAGAPRNQSPNDVPSDISDLLNRYGGQ